MSQTTAAGARTLKKVKCGDCRYFVRDGNCSFLLSPEGRDPQRKFEHSPFWVWSDCYSDKEQVFKATETLCTTFSARAALAKTGGAS